MNASCVHSCKGLCNALKIAEVREEEAIREYRQFAVECDYPDVRGVLEELIASRQHGLVLLRQIRETLDARFETLDNIGDSFA